MDKPWLDNYSPGVPVSINPDQYCSVVEILKEACEKYKGKPVFSCMGKTISFKQWDSLSDQYAAYLQNRGLEPNDRLAIMMPNCIQYPIAVLGALKAGLTVVNTNPLYTPREMEHQFTNSEVKAILIAENFAANLEQVLPQTNIKFVMLTSIGEMLGFVKGPMVDFVIRKIKRMVPKFNIANTVTFKEALKGGKKFKFEPVTETPDRVILHQYTGGTTGVSKAAMLTNRNILANCLQVRSIMASVLAENEIALCPLPLYHSFAFTVHICALGTYGTHNILIVNPRDLKTIKKAFDTYKINLMTGVNTLFNGIVNNSMFESLDYSSLKICIAGGMALKKSVAANWKKLTGCTVAEGYGLTETSPVATVNPIDGSDKPGSCGMPVPSTLVKIVGENGQDLPYNESGEIWIKGPQVMAGYYKQEKETNDMIEDGWLKTGDIGKMTADGFVWIVDRMKDMINVSGFNVFPNEIEDVFAGHEGVLECAAIGIDNEKSSECVKLFVVKKDSGLKAEDLMEFAQDKLTKYKLPREIEFMHELPKSNVGKVLRRKLKDMEEGKEA